MSLRLQIDNNSDSGVEGDFALILTCPNDGTSWSGYPDMDDLAAADISEGDSFNISASTSDQGYSRPVTWDDGVGCSDGYAPMVAAQIPDWWIDDGVAVEGTLFEVDGSTYLLFPEIDLATH